MSSFKYTLPGLEVHNARLQWKVLQANIRDLLHKHICRLNQNRFPETMVKISFKRSGFKTVFTLTQYQAISIAYHRNLRFFLKCHSALVTSLQLLSPLSWNSLWNNYYNPVNCLNNLCPDGNSLQDHFSYFSLSPANLFYCMTSSSFSPMYKNQWTPFILAKQANCRRKFTFSYVLA